MKKEFDLSIIRPKIGFKLLAPSPTLKLAIDASTKTNTKIGATDFNALINKSPNKLAYGAACGNKVATKPPNTMAIIIRETRLNRVRAENITEPYQVHIAQIKKTSGVFYTENTFIRYIY